MKAIDLKKYKTNEISFYLAIEEYLLDKDISDDCFFLWDIDKSIIIGKNQVVINEVNITKAKEKGVKIYRRPSGGGAIYADSGCFMYTFITKAREKDLVIKEKLSLILDSLKKIGVNCYFSGRNDLLFNDKKFSGVALYYKNNKVVLHGTFLYDTNLDDLEEILYSNKDKLITKGVASVRFRVINLKDYLPLNKNEVMDYLLDNICDEKVRLNKDDILNILKIKERFDSEDYILGLNPKYSIKKSHYFKFGLLEIQIDIKKDKIDKFKLLGDFFFVSDISEYEKEFIGYRYSDILEIINKLDISKYIIDCSNSDIIKLIYEL